MPRTAVVTPLVKRLRMRSATSMSPLKGRAGHLQGAPQVHPPVAPKEQARILERRIQKAECSEWKGANMALTPVKMCVGGLRARNSVHNVPTELITPPPWGTPHVRALHTTASASFGASAPTMLTPSAPSHKDRGRDPDDITLRYYIERKTEKESVAERKDAEGDLMPDLSASIVAEGFQAAIEPNERKIPAEVVADGTVQHPSGFIPPTPANFHAEIGVVTDGLAAVNAEPDRVSDVREMKEEEVPRSVGSDEVKPAGATSPTAPPAEKTDSFKRGLHTMSSRAPARTIQPPRSAFHSSTVARAKRQPDVDVTMRYYIERKAEKETIAERKEAEGDLMPNLSASIVADGFKAAIKPNEQKVPAEILTEDGVVQHPSGFVPPTLAAVHAEAGVIVDGLQALSDEVPAAMDSEPTKTDEVLPTGHTPPTSPPNSPSQSTASSFGSAGAQKREVHSSAIVRAREVSAAAQRAESQEGPEHGVPYAKRVAKIGVPKWYKLVQDVKE